MRPLPEEILSQLRRILDDVIRPDLTDQFACEQAELMSALLEHLRVRSVEEIPLLLEDSRDMHEVLRSTQLPAPIRARLSGVPLGEAALDAARVRANNDAFRQLLVEAIEHFEETEPDGEALSRIRALLRRSLDRERRFIGPGYALGT